MSDEQYRNLTAPPGESCKMYNHSYATWRAEDVSSYLEGGTPEAPLVDCMSGWSYSQDVYKSTIISEVNNL